MVHIIKLDEERDALKCVYGMNGETMIVKIKDFNPVNMTTQALIAKDLVTSFIVSLNLTINSTLQKRR